MIISFKNKFIFLHCRKTAGTSIQNLLSNFLGKKDIILGGFEKEKDSITAKLNQKMIIDSFLHPHIDGIKKMIKNLSFKDFVDISNKKFYEKILGNTPQHATAKNIQSKFPQIWNNFFKFCVVRNSYNQIYSHYIWIFRNLKNPPTFSFYLDALISKEEQIQKINILHPNNWEIYTINNKPVMDFIINFEQLDRDLRFVLEKLNIKTNIHLPFTKVNTNKKVSYSDLINLENKKKIQKLFGKEIEYFKFELN
tara:strand:+ start:221 stop:976 length:756 start_codon:yes stop_codon:yes gene_type:complete